MLRSIIVLMIVNAVALPSMAGVSLTANCASGTTMNIGYVYDGTGARPRAFALVIQSTGGTITSVTPAKTGLSTAGAPGFGIFPGTISIDESGNVLSYGTPVEPTGLPGGPSQLGTSRVVVAMGALYKGDANKPANAGNLFTIVCSAGTTGLTVTPETTNRKGVVGEDGTQITVAPPVVTFAPCLPPECVKNTAPFYGDWVSYNKPSCWCYKRHCMGDADGMVQGSTKTGYMYVSTNDLNVLIAAWNIKEPPYGSGVKGRVYAPSGVPLICADFDRGKQGANKTGYIRVSTNDINMIAVNWNVKEPPYGSGARTWPPGNTNCDAVNYNAQF